MKIVHGWPPDPILSRIQEAFDLEGTRPVFAFLDTLYCPYGGAGVDDALIAHEETHAKYQEEMGLEEWWDRYLRDKQFRFDQELEAYQVQYRHYCKNVSDRNRRVRFLDFIATSLSSKMYGSIVTKEEAMRLINQ